MFGFELHLTTRTHDLSAFVRSCQHLAVKPVIIELPFGECTYQPMLTTICHADRLSDVVCHSADLSKRLHALGFATLRTKIEILQTTTNDFYPPTLILIHTLIILNGMAKSHFMI